MTLARLCGDAALTPWYPPSVSPVRRGWYERLYPSPSPGARAFCYWNGERWSIAANAPGKEETWMISGYQALQWRGLKRRAK